MLSLMRRIMQCIDRMATAFASHKPNLVLASLLVGLASLGMAVLHAIDRANINWIDQSWWVIANAGWGIALIVAALAALPRVAAVASMGLSALWATWAATMLWRAEMSIPPSPLDLGFVSLGVPLIGFFLAVSWATLAHWGPRDDTSLAERPGANCGGNCLDRDRCLVAGCPALPPADQDAGGPRPRVDGMVRSCDPHGSAPQSGPAQ